MNFENLNSELKWRNNLYTFLKYTDQSLKNYVI